MVEQAMMWRSYGQIFDSKEEAEEYEKCKEFEKAVADIVESFYWQDCEGEDVVLGIIQNKDRLIEVLTK